MGNHKFRLSNIIPNSWFHKLKEPGRRSNTSSNQHHATPPPVQVPCNSRKSYHFTRNLNSRSSDSPVVDPPRKSSRKKRPTTTQSSSSSAAACSCATVTVHSVRSKPTSTTTTTTSSSLDNLVFLPPELHSFDRMVACSSTSCHTNSNSPVADEEDVVIGVDKMSPATKTQETLLPPIKTEHKKFSELVREIGGADDEEEEEETPIYDKPNKQRKSPARRISNSSSSPRIRIRVNSPRLSRRVETNGAGRKSMSRRRKSLKSPDSMAVVKSSADPERDFRESMVEMIVENEIRAAKDLEELLACYLSLNSIEHHHLIVQVFTQIWFDLNRIH